MFNDKRISIEKVKDIIYKVKNEFSNELDFDYDYNGRELTDDDLNMLEDCVNNFANKLELTINDELVDCVVISKYTDEDIEVFKQVLIGFDRIKSEIDTLINNGYNLTELQKKIFDIPNIVEITNYSENEYIDFQYADENFGAYLTIYKNNNTNEIYLMETAEIWVNCDFLGSYYMQEIENIIEKYESGKND
jgi:transcriptional regulator